MPMGNIGLVGLLMIFCTGCVGVLSSSTPPVYFELSYENAATVCAGPRQGTLRIWPFSASAPYDREEMIILEPSRRVRFSPHFRWITSPGGMIADKLTRDLSGTGPFAPVTPAAGNPSTSGAQLSGHVHQFAWEDLGNGNQQALLDVQISLWREAPEHDVPLQKRYRLESERIASGSPEQFAEVMSRLVADLSARLQEDLCAREPDSSSRPSD
jgi:hypothetical protein